MDLDAIEALYKQYKDDPKSVDASFQFFFQGFDLATRQYPVKPTTGVSYSENFAKEMAVLNLIAGYRRRGHLFTKQIRFALAEPIRRHSISKISISQKVIWILSSRQATKSESVEPSFEISFLICRKLTANLSAWNIAT